MASNISTSVGFPFAFSGLGSSMASKDQLCWVHFGDLPIRKREDEN